VIVASVPWAFHGSGFTQNFEYSAAWLATQLNKSAVTKYMRISWDTVGNIISRVHNDVEPNICSRLDDLHVIGIDETSFRNGHKYITVVVNHETNTVVWVHDGHVKKILTLFMKQLTPEQRASIKVVSGDGARWITDCAKEYLPGCERCVDSFHVAEWAMESLDSVRRQSWHEAQSEAKSYPKQKPGRPKNDDATVKAATAAKEKAASIKGSTYALGKAPENLTETQAAKLEMIQLSDNRLYRAYKLKEQLRLILKMTDVEAADAELTKWAKWARHCRIPEFVELQRKIMRHRQHILNTIKLDVSNARIEANNNKIKLIIRRSIGFRNIRNC
jgi:transposase